MLATDSQDPSGLGEHMLTLAEVLAADHRVTLAFGEGEGAAPCRRAATRRGLDWRLTGGMDSFADWLWREADLLHVHAGIGWEGLALGAAGRAARRPVVRTEHLPYLLTDAAQIAAHAAAAAEAGRIIAVSEAARASYIAHGIAPDKVVAIPNGVCVPVARQSRAAMRAALGVTGPLLLHVARFTPQKNHAALLAAFRDVLAARPEARLLLAGDGAGRARAERLAARLGLSRAVRFLGRRDDVPDLLAAADVFVLPSRFEGLPLSVLEAMAAGVPVVASRIGGTLEALGADHPFTAPPRDAAALARAILAALDPVAGPAAARAARARFGQLFDAERMGRATAAVYARILTHP